MLLPQGKNKLHSGEWRDSKTDLPFPLSQTGAGKFATQMLLLLSAPFVSGQ